MKKGKTTKKLEENKPKPEPKMSFKAPEPLASLFEFIFPSGIRRLLFSLILFTVIWGIVSFVILLTSPNTFIKFLFIGLIVFAWFLLYGFFLLLKKILTALY